MACTVDGGALYGLEAILQFTSDSAKTAAFDHYWKRLETASENDSDLAALELCIRLLPLSMPDERVSSCAQ